MNRAGNEHIHTHTPTLTVVDPRGLDVRSVAYWRSVETTAPEERVNRSAYDAMGRLVEQWDPRLWALKAEEAATPANLSNRYSLSGKVLDSISVDAGERISLFGDGDQLIQTWDSRDTERRVEYDDLLRPLAIFEQGEGQPARCTERYEYANGDTAFAAHNQCGQLIRHDDPAGTQTLDEYALTGGVLEQAQRFLHALQSPDWPPGLEERDALLEPVAQAATRATRFNPLGEVLEQIDAKGNRQLLDYTVDGQLFASHLQLSGQATPQTLVSDIAYNAYRQVEQETAGNGVISTLRYRPEDGRLLHLQARQGQVAPLQDLRYEYDPVGNVLSIEDGALPTRYFANQRVEPVNRYRYDSLYQLTEAFGWEAGRASRGPGFNRFDDPGAVANYQQTYHYDAGGNLLELIHVGPQNHSRKLVAARHSNRCLAEHNDRPPTEEDIATAFDGNGNLLELQPGRTMTWDLRNQLREVRPVEREGDEDDRELYLYGGDGMRRRKVRSTQTNARSLISEVRYLPGLEIRTRDGTGEILQVICVQAGRSAMQVLHWETAPPAGIYNDQYRYNLTDHLGSSSLELDSEAEVISQETYHPYGSTAWFAGRSEVEATYKTVRYSGKERDATGLYYYGFRYYASWLQRWINPDPAGSRAGLNTYRMVSNNPLSRVDIEGLMDRPPPVPNARPPSSGARASAAFRPPPLSLAEMIAFTKKPPPAPSQTNKSGGGAPPGLQEPHVELILGANFVPGKKIKDVSSSYETTVHEFSDDWIVIKDYSSMIALDASEVTRQRIGAANEVFAYKVSQHLGLNIVPATVLRPNSDREVVSRYVNVGETLSFDRRQSSMYVFDFLLNTRDRTNDGGNVIFDQAGKAFAIDHQSILELGYVDIRPEDIAQNSLDAFSSNPTATERLNSTDWGSFFEDNISPLLIENRVQIKAAFLGRIDFIRNRLGNR
ncbi:RHS repeat domain-containing protein [Pseudomonas citrulli]|uniref:RHS repeat-associated core domain-containing protein n=1 Tax=Pseudomonas citrulli TaxID=3064347 RepID=A0ABT9C3Q1_9PSED|nr:RHS repeat-associated core domain-containing protein [Pseudomonas sp. K18]MDO7899430.1 RHS repeat-associated core domain-containing protein [Pseudomonas sp. K18]